MAASAPQFQSGWRIPLKAPIELSNINVFKRFRNYCGLIKVARSGFPWEKTTKGDVAPPEFLRAALTEGNDVRLSSRKAACIFVAHQAPQEIRVRSTPIAKPL